MKFPNKKYQIIYADPPWAYPESGSNAKVHDRHYECMSLFDICSLTVKFLADKNCALFLWVTFPRLFDAEKVIEHWGFKYKTIAFNWVKRNKISDSYFMGPGAYTRANGEVCLLALKGNMLQLKKSNSVRQVCDARIERHSKKPDEIRNRIVDLFGDLPRIELFARQNTSGWEVWGNDKELQQGEKDAKR